VKFTKKDIDFILDDNNSSVINWYEFIKPDIVDNLPLVIADKILLEDKISHQKSRNDFAQVFFERNKNLTVDFIKKHINEIKFIELEFSPLSKVTIVGGLFRNLRFLILNDKRNIVEEIVINFYDNFIDCLDKLRVKNPGLIESAEAFKILYKLHVTEKMSNKLKLFLKLI
jgi:hypothetical protein